MYLHRKDAVRRDAASERSGDWTITISGAIRETNRSVYERCATEGTVEGRALSAKDAAQRGWLRLKHELAPIYATAQCGGGP
ncbi:MAG: hypothetical protein ACLSIF_06560 [Faecalimonas umbilicata]